MVFLFIINHSDVFYILLKIRRQKRNEILFTSFAEKILYLGAKKTSGEKPRATRYVISTSNGHTVVKLKQMHESV